MRLTSTLISTIFLTISIPAHAQFGNLLKDFKGTAEAIQKSVQEGQPSKDGNPLSLPSPGGGMLSSDEYCNRFSNSPSVLALSKAMVPVKDRVATLEPRHTFLDNSNGDLEKWVVSNITKAIQPVDKFTNPQVKLNSMIDSVNLCIKKNGNSDLALVSVYNSSSIGSNNKNNIYTIYADTLKLGKLGNHGSHPREATLLAFLFAGAEEEIKKISPDPTASFNAFADSLKQHQKKLADNKAAEAEKEAQASKYRAEAAAFSASPDGQLLYSYQHFQIVQVCHDMRKGLAVQFVTANEMSDFKSKMKQIENKLKGSVKDKNTDRIWKAAEENNRNFGSIEIDGKQIKGIDLIAAITSNNKSNWVSAKSDCDIQVEAFREMIKDVLGNEQLKKSF